ncbi:MAG TPA: FHA domain-containing protein [Gallionella sp.]|nr:FHA domain-containing protein [Gallionella sp.]
MAWTECSQGHTYNSDEHSMCPHCGVKAGPTVIHNPPVGVVGFAEKSVSRGAVPASNAGKTVAILPTRAGQSADSNQTTFDPVTGWLVCTKGKDCGKDFRIVSGWNGIGRDPSMAICIPSDESISRQDHAKILYESKKRTFHLAAGDGRNAVYLNGDVLLQPAQLKYSDVIELGNTQLRFIPLCGEQFVWE